VFAEDSILAEGVMAVNAGTEQHLKRASERVLMDAGGAVEPVVDVDIKPWTSKKRDWRITKASWNILLFREANRRVHPANDVPGIDLRW
jgi:hypothetical protein